VRRRRLGLEQGLHQVVVKGHRTGGLCVGTKRDEDRQRSWDAQHLRFSACTKGELAEEERLAAARMPEQDYGHFGKEEKEHVLQGSRHGRL
jgi:hypothetical protein